MSRGLDATTLASVTAQDVSIPVLFAELDFPSGFVRVHTIIGTITWGGYDWTGVGTLGQVSTVEESAELSRKTITYTLSGIPGSMISIVLGEQYQGRTAKLYFGVLSPTTGQLIATPVLIDRGLMDVSEIEEGETCSVTITAENRIASWDRPVVRRYTNADQQARFPGDKGLEFVDQAADKEINWGRKDA